MLFVAQQSAGAIFVQLVVQSLETDLQEFSRAGFVVPGLLERAQDHLSFDLFQRCPNRKRGRVFVTQLLPLIERVGSEVMSLNLFSRTDDDGAFDYVAQLAHITRPRMITERIKRRRTNEPCGPIVLRGESRN